MGEKVADTDAGPVWTGKIEWGEESERSVSEVLAATVDSCEGTSAVGEATDWLADYLEMQGGTKASSICKSAGKTSGHSESAIKRAARKLKLEISQEGYPRTTVWSLPSQQSVQPVGESELNELNGPTRPDLGRRKTSVGSAGSVSSVGAPPTRGEPTGESDAPF